MQRWLATLVGIAAVVLTVLMVARNFHAPKGAARELAWADAAPEDAGALLHALADKAADSAPPAIEEPERETFSEAGAGLLLPDGTPAPPLPRGAPRQVRFGVVLVSYLGAQQTVETKAATRSKDEAWALAKQLLVAARQDFHSAVQQGDSGSSDDLGQMKPGFLEPAPEYVIFTLPVDGVGGPIDTPRGYWIVKRLE